jgi:hypothetical protein
LEDHLRHRQVPAMELMPSSLLAIAVAPWALALKFAVPLIRKWSGRAALPG